MGFSGRCVLVMRLLTGSCDGEGLTEVEPAKPGTVLVGWTNNASTDPHTLLHYSNKHLLHSNVRYPDYLHLSRYLPAVCRACSYYYLLTRTYLIWRT